MLTQKHPVDFKLSLRTPKVSTLAFAAGGVLVIIAVATLTTRPLELADLCLTAQGRRTLDQASEALLRAQNAQQRTLLGGAPYIAAKVGPIPGVKYEQARLTAEESVRQAQMHLVEAEATCHATAVQGASE